MSRYIDADELQAMLYHKAFEEDSDLQRWDSGCWIRYKMFENVMEQIPTADVQEVKHGRWIETTVPELWECSVCGCVIYSETEIDRKIYHKWCGRCGAKMEGHFEEPEINPCRGCEDYDGKGGCISNGGCGAKMDEVTE